MLLIHPPERILGMTLMTKIVVVKSAFLNSTQKLIIFLYYLIGQTGQNYSLAAAWLTTQAQAMCKTLFFFLRFSYDVNRSHNQTRWQLNDEAKKCWKPFKTRNLKVNFSVWSRQSLPPSLFHPLTVIKFFLQIYWTLISFFWFIFSDVMKTGSEQFPNLKAFKLTLMMLLKTIFLHFLFIYYFKLTSRWKYFHR